MTIGKTLKSIGTAVVTSALLASVPSGALAGAGGDLDRMLSSGHQSPSGGSPISPQRVAGADTAHSSKRYYVQFGAFSQYARAQSLVQQLHNSGIGSVQIIKRRDNGRLGVQSGPFSSPSAAESLQSRGEAIGLNTVVLTEQRKL